MKQVSKCFSNLVELRAWLTSKEITEAADICLSMMAMVFSSQVDAAHIRGIVGLIAEAFPQMQIVGATTTGEIDNGETVTYKTTVTFSFFASTTIVPIAFPCKRGEEPEVGLRLRKKVDELHPSAVMFLDTPLSIDTDTLMRSFIETPFRFELFGGGAGDYAMETSYLACNDLLLDSGVLAVAFVGEALQIVKTTFLGWRAMSQEMKITKASGLSVLTIDNQPAFDVYRRYLNIQDDKNFFASAVGFPMLTEQGSDVLARVPVAVGEGNSLQFISGFEEGETFRLGFVDPSLIEENLSNAQRILREFEPDAILLFTCGCRRFALLGNIQSETQPFADIAPTSGFYSTGEFCNIDQFSPQLNLAFVVVGLREGVLTKKHSDAAEFQHQSIASDKFISSHTTVMGRLLYFIDRLNDELAKKNQSLEEKNLELYRLSVTDQLTSLFNRNKLNEVLKEELNRAEKFDYVFGIILLDADYFKIVNDTFGHQVGDQVLIDITNILGEQTRQIDITGRWGGEEFLIVCPGTNKDGAVKLAEKLRVAVEQHEFAVAGHKTASFGVTIYQAEDTIKAMISRADEALYQAKGSGRNQVVFR